MSELTLTYAGTPYFDRVQPLIDGRVPIDGLEIQADPSWNVVDLFVRVVQEASFEISEMSMCTALMMLSRGDDRYVLLPIFPSRAFRHSQIYVNAQSGIEHPDDLKGKLVGVLDYQATAALWLRGTLQEEFGVLPSEIRWRLGGVEAPGYKERMSFEPPHDVEIEVISSDRTLVEMLETGELDALFAVRAPSTFRHGSDSVRRLFVDYRKTEMDYFRRTALFPIMHGIVLRRDIYDANPWAANSLVEGFFRARKIGRRSLTDSDKPSAMHAWLPNEIEEMDRFFGGDPFRYGVPRNRRELETMIRYGVEQGLLAKPLTLAEIFPPEVLDWDEPDEPDWVRV